MNTIIAIDFDKHAAATYAANFPGVDVRCASVAEQITSLPYADVLTGGFPCQPHSLAGKRKASQDERDGGADFVAAIAKAKPRIFLGENVAGLVTSENGRYFRWIVGAMEAAGYVVQVRILDAVNFGAPQFRERVWFWGIRQDVYEGGVRHLWPTPTHAWPWPQSGGLFGGHQLERAITVGWALNIPHMQCDGEWWEGNGGDVAGSIAKRRDGARGWSGQRIVSAAEPSPAVTGEGRNPESLEFNGDNSPMAHEYRWSSEMLQKHPPASPASPVMAKWYKGGANRDATGHLGGGCPPALSVDGRTWDHRHPAATPDALSPAVRARSPRDQGRCTENILRDKLYVRRLTPEECMRLMSAPDDFVFPAGVAKTHQYRIAGNGWASVMGHVFARAFSAADPKSRTVIDLYCGGGLGACGWHGRYWKYDEALTAAQAVTAE